MADEKKKTVADELVGGLSEFANKLTILNEGVIEEVSFVVPDKDSHVFATGVFEVLDKLGLDFDYDEVSPPNDLGEITYKIHNVGWKR